MQKEKEKMRNDSMSEVTIELELPQELYEKLVVLAKQEKRTVEKQIEWILKEWFEPKEWKFPLPPWFPEDDKIMPHELDNWKITWGDGSTSKDILEKKS